MMDHSYWHGDTVNINSEKIQLTKNERKLLILIDIIFVSCLSILLIVGVLACSGVPWLHWLLESPFSKG